MTQPGTHPVQDESGASPDPHFFPEVLKTYPAQLQVVWLYFREFPVAPGDPGLLTEQRGGSEQHHRRCLRILRDAGLLVVVRRDRRPVTGHVINCYRVCTEQEAAHVRPYSTRRGAQQESHAKTGH